MNTASFSVSRRASRTLATTLAGLAAISTASAQPQYAVTDLGVLPGYASSATSRLNDRGDVVGWVITSASAINNAGQIVGSGTCNGVSRAILLTPIAE